jgi:hypothetical protein
MARQAVRERLDCDSRETQHTVPSHAIDVPPVPAFRAISKKPAKLIATLRITPAALGREDSPRRRRASMSAQITATDSSNGPAKATQPYLAARTATRVDNTIATPTIKLGTSSNQYERFIFDLL